MAGSLILLDEFSPSGDTEVILGGGTYGSSGANVSIDNTYNIYFVTIENLVGSVDGASLRHRLYQSGAAESDALYDYGFTVLDSGAAYSPNSTRLASYFQMHQSFGNVGGENMSGSLFYYNLGNSSVYCSVTYQLSNHSTAGIFHGFQGGGTYRKLIAPDGLYFYVISGTMDSGKFKLYGLKK